MIAAEKVAVVLLAAGTSRRFGSRDKLAQPLDGMPLGLHAARMLSRFSFAAKIVVARDRGPDFQTYGFTVAINRDPDAGQSGSIAIGVARARAAEPEAILIVLADMPLVPAMHIEALLARSDEHNPVVASTSGAMPGPPALFRASLFHALATLAEDKGARHLLSNATMVTAPPSTLIDVDTPDDLAIVGARSTHGN